MDTPDDLIDCEITGMTAGGEGVARHLGKVVFVPGGLVGERVRIAVTKPGSRSDRGRIVEVLVPSGRRETPCRHDHRGGCGGCGLLHATRESQARAKRIVVADAIERLAGESPAKVGAILTPGPEFGYRNHARFGVDRDGRLTYVARQEEGGRRDAIVIETCAVLHPELDRLRSELAGRVQGVTSVELRIGARTGERLVVLHGAAALPRSIDATRVEAAIALERNGRLQPVRGFPLVHEVVLGRRFRISAASFFQVNTDGAACLAEVVRGLAAERPPRSALDLYAGVGLFSGCALEGAVRVIGVEMEPSAADDFRHNAKAVPGARLRAEPVAEVLRDLGQGREAFDLAVVNPPRAGMGAAVVRALVPLGIPRLVLVSCDPGSLGRDLGELRRAGYELRSATPVDQFPGTPHVETVALLERG